MVMQMTGISLEDAIAFLEGIGDVQDIWLKADSGKEEEQNRLPEDLFAKKSAQDP